MGILRVLVLEGVMKFDSLGFVSLPRRRRRLCLHPPALLVILRHLPRPYSFVADISRSRYDSTFSLLL